MNIRNNNHIFVVAIILSSALSTGLEISHSIAYNNTAKATLFEINKSQFKRAPEFTGTTGHINTLTPIKLADLKGKVVLVHFWTYTCINCIHTIPYLNGWYQKYSNRGLVIIGVQTPEFNSEKNIDNVNAAVQNSNNFRQ